MSEKPPTNTPEKGELLNDNARKFVTEIIDHELLEKNQATSFTLTVDWLETGEDNEKKVAYKKFDNGDTQILLIAKVTIDGDRSSVKEKITEAEYKKLLDSSTLHLEKKRHEFEYAQDDITFSMKLDEFSGGKLYMLEVDAQDEEDRSSFDPNSFPIKLEEVTGDLRYYGYRVAGII
jgi:hypothetical protein